MLMHNNQYKLNIFQVQKVPGTRSHHCFIPLKNGTLKISRIAGEQTSTNVLIHVNEHFPVIQDLQPGNSIAAVSWEMLWKYSRTVQIYICIGFMQSNRPSKSFSWPKRKDEYLVLTNHNILVVIDGFTSSSRCQYKLTDTSTK